jgi:hypothetical protein
VSREQRDRNRCLEYACVQIASTAEDSVARFKLVPRVHFSSLFFQSRRASIARNNVRIANNKSRCYCEASIAILAEAI